jgi:hypothetical protein
MGNRYLWTDEGHLKPKLRTIEGFVSIGTGGQVNALPAYPVFPTATGATGGIAGSVQTGVPYGTLPGQATAGLPTGWVGGFSGCQGLLGYGVKGVQRVATGQIVMVLEDDWVGVHKVDCNVFSGATGHTGVDWGVIDHTVGLGNTIATGGVTGWLGKGINPYRTIFFQFINTTSGLAVDLGVGAGFWVDIVLIDALGQGTH